MSEPRHLSERSELETVVNWRMIAAGAALGAGALVAAVAFLVLAPPRAPGPAQALAPRPAAPAGERRVVLPAVRRSTPAAPPVVAAVPEFQPPRVEKAVTPFAAPVAVPAPARVVVAAAPAPAEMARRQEAPAPVATPFKRIRPYGEWELLYLLDKQAKEVDLDAKAGTCKTILEEAAKGPAPQADRADKEAAYPLPKVQPVLDAIAKRDDLKGLPLRMGNECVSGGKAAEAISRISKELRTSDARRRRRGDPAASFSATIEQDEAMVKLLSSPKTKWGDEAGVPALVQMLQTENLPVRLQLVAMLAPVKGEKASAALAARAVFDASAEVREAAVKALKGRPRAEYRQTLLDALRYPWIPVAEHAAETLVALDDQDSFFALLDLLDAPDPAAPARDKDDKWVVTEVVRVNHLRNCLLCHAPSFSDKEPIRALVPEKGKPLPEVYYESRKGSFVRADVVYLKQDFSVLQPVSDAKPWPAVQRFDYLTRRRELTREEVATMTGAKRETAPSSYPQRQAVLWAMRELSGEDAGERSEDWYRALVRAYFGIE